MYPTFLNPIILVTEGRIDASIIYSLINTGDRKVFMVIAGGYQNIASIIRTQYLMHGDEYNYIGVFDSDSDSDDVRNERLSMVKYLSKAEIHPNIGIFCFRNTIEMELGFPKLNKNEPNKLINVLKDRKEQMQECDTIREIQAFVNNLR